MSEKRFKTLTIIIEDGFGTATTSIRSELSAPQLMDKIFELKEENEQLKSDIMLIEKNADRHYEENKQLKKELNEYRQVIIDKVQYYEDNLEDFLIKKGVIEEDWARFDDYD